MRNRAKCKLCEDILESFHRHDYVECSCGEIALDGGRDYYKCSAKNWENFIRIDDQGKEVPVKVQSNEKEEIMEIPKPTKQEMIEMLNAMIKNIERLPSHAMSEPITHYDFCALLTLLYAVFTCD